MISHYSDLTIRQYLQCKLIADLEPDPIVRKMKMLAEISGKDLDWAESLPLIELKTKLSVLDKISEMPETIKAKMTFKVGGKKWKIRWRAQELTGEQYIDATHFCKGNPETNIHNILASLATEIRWGIEKPYSGETHKERADLFFNEMKISQAYPIMVFFCKYSKILADNTQTYLAKEAEKVVKITKKHLEQNGVGLLQ